MLFRSKVGCGYRFAVGVEFHIKRLYILGIMGEKHGFFEHFFGKLSFVFALKIHAPVNGRVETVFYFRENVYRLGIGKALKFVV